MCNAYFACFCFGLFNPHIKLVYFTFFFLFKHTHNIILPCVQVGNLTDTMKALEVYIEDLSLDQNYRFRLELAQRLGLS